MTNSDLTLVLGGTGKTGRRVAQRLRALGRPVRIGSRAGDPPFDWTDRATWPGSLVGVRAAYLTYQPDIAFPGAADIVGDYAALAAASGVRRLVLLSGRGEDGALAGEKAVAAAGVEWAAVRSAFFMQNFTEDFLAGRSRRARSRCRPATCRSRSSTPTTSPTSRSPRWWARSRPTGCTR